MGVIPAINVSFQYDWMNGHNFGTNPYLDHSFVFRHDFGNLSSNGHSHSPWPVLLSVAPDGLSKNFQIWNIRHRVMLWPWWLVTEQNDHHLTDDAYKCICLQCCSQASNCMIAMIAIRVCDPSTRQRRLPIRHNSITFSVSAVVTRHQNGC